MPYMGGTSSGVVGRPMWNLNGQPQGNNPIKTQYDLYNTAVEQQAGDYDSIMKAYRDYALTQSSNPKQGQYTPTTSPYEKTADVTKSLADLSSLTDTGGYTPQGIQELRARGMSPIRSIYAGANRDIDRQRSLQGGYSPNYGAMKLRMGRDMSESIGKQMSDVNAGIAQNVASNKLSAAPNYASAAATQGAAQNQHGLANANIMNEAGRFNAGQGNQTNTNILGAIQGQANLYGTTPALSSLFGQQAVTGASLQNQINQSGQNAALTGISRLARR